MEQEFSGPQAQYFDMLKSGVFKIQRCDACASHVFFPRTLCPHCGSESLQWVEPSGRGEIYSITTIRRDAQHGGDYNVALIDLAEGVRLMAHVAAIGAAPPAIGDAVTLVPPEEMPEKAQDVLYFKLRGKVRR